MKSYKSPIIYLYPNNYELDMLHKRKYWECIPILPNLDIQNVQKSLKLVKLSDKDEKKNRIIKEITY